MLVLTRKKNESIMIGGEIEIVIADITPTQVRVGISAPKNLEIYRKEIFDAIRDENLKAAISGLNEEKIQEELENLFKKN